MAPKKRKPKTPPTFHPTPVVLEAHARSIGVDPEADQPAYEFLCKVLQKPLPEPWTEHADKKGRIFYWNRGSRSSTWQHPMTPTHRALLAAWRRIVAAQAWEREDIVTAELEAFRIQGEEELNQWRKSSAADGTPYYYKVGTQLTRWDDPRDELMGHMELRADVLWSLVDSQTVPEEGFAVLGSPLDSAADAADLKALALSPSQGRGNAVTAEGAAAPDVTTQALQPPEKKKKSKSRQGSKSRGGTPPHPQQGQLDLPASPERKDSKATYRAAQEQLIGMGFPKRDVKNALSHAGGEFEPALQILLESSFDEKEPREARPKESQEKSGEGLSHLLNLPEVPEPVGIAGLSPKSEPQSPSRAGMSSSMSSRFRVERPPVGATPLLREAEELPFTAASQELQAAVIPDALAVTLGLQLDVAADMAAYQILKPLFFSALPLPWEVHKKAHGRWDFFHAGVKEYRQQHPMHGFFSELLEFLRANASTSTPITELLEAQVFRTASPEMVRYRLGIWEGPVQDAETGGVSFIRQWPGHDEVCVEALERMDDPRLEAAANMSFRLGAWLHLWKGFAGKEEPFPLLEGRLSALCQQLGECVVTAPGMATTQMIAHMEELLPRFETQPEPEVIHLTEEEEAYQPLVTSILAKAYSVAIAEAARRETKEMLEEGRLPGDSDSFAARIACNLVYRGAQVRVADLEHEEWVAQQFPAEEAEDEDYEREFEEDFVCEEEEEEEENTSEEDVEAQGEREVEAESELPMEEEEEDEEDIAALVEDVEPQVEETDDVQRVIQTCKGFIARLEEDHDAWAKQALRPWTPITGRQDPEPLSPKAQWPESPKVALHRKRLGWNEEIWSPTREAEEGEVVPDPPAEEEEEPMAPGEEAEQELLAFVQQLGEEAEGLTAEDEDVPTAEAVEEADAAATDEDPRAPAEEAPEPAMGEAEGATDEPAEEVAGTAEAEPEPDVPEVYKEMCKPTMDLTMSPDDWPMLRRQLPEPLEEKVDEFRKQLEAATNSFNQSTGMPETEERAQFQRSYGWNWLEKEPDDPECYRTGREFLDRPSIKDPLCRDRDGGNDEEHDMVVTGAAARPPSPNRGAMRVPPYLEGAAAPPTGAAAGRPAFPMARARSSSPRLVRKMPQTAKQQAATRLTRQAVKKPPAQAKLEPRPGSADCYTRPRRDSLMPDKPSAAAVEAAKSTKRFLSRTCGTMQAALTTFDPSGDGRFSREEWVLGLDKLDFTVGHDPQEIFTVLDKRQHHMLTLSDLLDYCKGIPIDTGMPPPGIRGAMSKLFQEILDEQLASIVQEALVDVAKEGLLHPSGAPGELPDVFAYCKYLQQVKKQKEQELQKQLEARLQSPSHASLAASHSQEGFESDLSEESEPDEEETESEPSSSESESDSDGDEEEDIMDQAADDPPPAAKVKKARDKDRETCAATTQVADALRAALDRDPSPEEIAEQKLKEATGAQPSAKEIKKEVKKVAKSEAKVAGIVPPPSKVTKKEKEEAAKTQVATEELRLELGRAPTRGEVARKKIEVATGHPPSQQEIRKEVKKAVKIEAKKEAVRQERKQRKQQEKEMQEAAAAAAAQQEKPKIDKKPPSSSSSSRRGRTAATDSKLSSSEGDSRLGSRGKHSPLGSRGGSRQGKKGHKRGSMLEMVLTSSSFSGEGNEDGIHEDLEWMESALTTDTSGRDKEVNPLDEITKAKGKIKKKEGRKKSPQKSSQSQSRHRASSSDLPMARFSGFSFVEREDYGQDLPESKLLPFVPRPASEICKTYGHIFRILADPRVKRLKVDPKKTRSVDVSVPRQPGANFGSSGAGHARSEGGDTFDSEAPPMRSLRGDAAQAGSRSSPSLRTTQASTTANTWRPGSSGSDERTGVVLPPIAQGEKQRPHLPDLRHGKADGQAVR